MLKKFGLILFSILLLAAITGYLITLFTAGHSQAIVPLSHAQSLPAHTRVANTLRIMTLNIAHGRKDSFNQLFLSKNKIKENLSHIARVIKNLDLDIVALQEADHISFWSGNFDHVKYLSRQASFQHSVHGLHVNGLHMRYGTALLTRNKPMHSYSFAFDATPPTFSKGFVVTTVSWPGDPDFKLDIISIHLDYSRIAVQKNQIRQLLEFLKTRKNPTIVMGDFNIDWSKSNRDVLLLLTQNGLTSVNTTTANLVTFPGSGNRLDWIFVTPELRVDSENILSKTISDHFAVITTVRRKQSNPSLKP